MSFNAVTTFCAFSPSRLSKSEAIRFSVTSIASNVSFRCSACATIALRRSSTIRSSHWASGNFPAFGQWAFNSVNAFMSSRIRPRLIPAFFTRSLTYFVCDTTPTPHTSTVRRMADEPALRG
ncbi:hypothetical protein ALI144C_07830 [Actinosynnema sp. ALI-1.44]|nr:hypothetical protein ALI144C_07830 [Actinosynnema sp. ALI-1.44]